MSPPPGLLSPCLLVSKHSPHLANQILNIVGKKSESPASHRLWQGRGAGSDHWQAASHRFHDRNAKPLVKGRHHEQIGRAVSIEQIFITDLAYHVKTVRDAQSAGLISASLGFLSVSILRVAYNETVNLRNLVF